MPSVPSELIFTAGLAHLLVLLAAAMVPFKLDWRGALGPLPPLHRQMYVVYGGYIILSIVAFAVISIVHAPQLAGGDGLARAVCLYMAVFWGVRLALQWVLAVKPYLTSTLDRLGYHALTMVFVFLTLTYTWAALGPSP